MAESTPFKEGINAHVIQHYVDELPGITTTFDAEGFRRDALDGLDDLELKARVKQLAACLRSHLDDDYPTALGHLITLLQRADRSEKPAYSFQYWPIAQFVEDHGIDHLEASAAAMKEITKRFTCEFAVRPFLVRYPEQMLAEMHRWAEDDDVHVRRNASEGIRPRLPWGLRLQAFVDDPRPVFEVLERLRHDPEEYVRRSVSNGLNDIAKDHPEPLMDLLERWDATPDDHTVWIKTRALRTLVKAGNPRALALLGFGPPEVEVRDLSLDASRYSLGDTMEIGFTLHSTGDAAQQLVIDYRVHFVKKNGSRTPKVFKLKNMTLEPGESIDIVRRQHLKPISTRRYHPGRHAVDVQVNGQVFASMEFDFDLG